MIEKIKYPMPGIIREILINEGDRVERGQTLAILESMKMHNNIESNISGQIVSINFGINDFVKPNEVIIEIET